jgi:hypothetical protein
MVRSKTRRIRKHRGGGLFDTFKGMVGMQQTISTDPLAVPKETNTRSWWQKLAGRKQNSTSVVPAAVPVSLNTGAPPTVPQTQPQAVGGSKKKRHTVRRHKVKSYKKH